MNKNMIEALSYLLSISITFIYEKNHKPETHQIPKKDGEKKYEYIVILDSNFSSYLFDQDEEQFKH
jgi:hypothetical protein